MLHVAMCYLLELANVATYMYVLCFSTWYVWLLLVTYQVEKKTKSGNLM